MNKHLLNKQERVLRAFSDSNVLFVNAGFLVEQRTVFGLSGEDSDLAVSIEWSDAAGCKWAADFTEENLLTASFAHNQITLNDSEGESVYLECHDLKPGKV